MTKCACQMTGLEILQANLEIERPHKSILIVDRGRGWDVTVYGTDSAGRPRDDVREPDCITIQATLECVEECLVDLRRQPDVEQIGEVITDPAEIASALSGKP